MYKSYRYWLLAVLLTAVLLRLGAAFYLGDVVDAPAMLTDQRSYAALGESLVAGHGFSFVTGWYPFTPPNTPTAHWSFLQSLYVAAIYAMVGAHPLAVRLTTAVIGGVLLPLLVFLLARRLFPAGGPSLHLGSWRIDEPIPLLAALLAAGYLYFVLYAATLMTETFYIIALLWSFERALALRSHWRQQRSNVPTFQRSNVPTFPKPALSLPKPALSLPKPALSLPKGANATLGLTFGLSLALAILFRQSILPWVPLLFLWLLWVNVQTFQHVSVRTLTPLFLAGLVLIAAILPFTLRNYRVYGEFLLLNSNTGYAMYSAQHPMHGTDFREFDPAPVPSELLVQGLNEAQLDKALLARGIGFVLEDPGRYLLLSLSRVKDYFEFWPTPDTTLLHNIGRVGSFGLLLPCFIAGIWLALRRARRAAEPFFTSAVALLLLFALFYSLLHILTWAFPRYRLPVDAVLLPFAALALVHLVDRLNRSHFAQLGLKLFSRVRVKTMEN